MVVGLGGRALSADQVRAIRNVIASSVPNLKPGKVTVQIQYQLGSLPPRFLYMDKDQWTKEREAAAIKGDIARTMAAPGEIINV